METTGFMGGVNSILEWISRLAWLNLLWISFSLLGIIVFGFFPATIAMFAVVRKWAVGEMEISIFKTFLNSYKQEFVKSNLLGLVLMIITVILVIDFVYLYQTSSDIQNVLFVPFMVVSLIFVCMLFYIFPMYVHFDMEVLQVIKNSFFVMIMNPLQTLLMLVGTSGLLFLLSYAPPLLIICSGNILAMAITKPAFNAFSKVNRKHQKIMQKQ
ncbi:YesL family protein [uncultured Metabacillus sp.]|uniref:YesL family protein n=1 Tax=uncultured Metabacillus sp. TaxID=2860135 RepID=UPI0026388CF7|nr:YesL family protein [uncultured Metabacillus sp.]